MRGKEVVDGKVIQNEGRKVNYVYFAVDYIFCNIYRFGCKGKVSLTGERKTGNR